jgi:hypothetical protein
MLGTDPKKIDLQSVKKRYEHLPCSYIANPQTTWQRIHQLVLHQTVFIKKEYPHEVFVEVPHLLCRPSAMKEGENLCGWMQKKDVVYLDQLLPDTLQYLPNRDDLIKESKNQTTAFLKEPYFVKELGVTLSATTQCVVAKQEQDHLLCYFFHPTKKTTILAKIPKTLATIPPSTKEAQLELFFNLIHTWAYPKKGFVPYVLGGASITTYYKGGFIKKPILAGKKILKNSDGQLCYLFDRQFSTQFKSGVDCSTLVYLAARCANLPYFCKNTTTVANTLKKVTKNTPLKKGDIIVFPGHMMVISELHPLKILQSRGYSSGFGRVAENDAKDLFYTIKDAKDLKKAYLQKKPLVFKNQKGKKGSEYKTFAIYQFVDSLPL